MKRHQEDVHEFRVTVHPELLNRLRTEDEELLIDIERRYAGRLIFRSDASLHVEKFSIANAQTNEELTA
jgi:ribonuclease G